MLMVVIDRLERMAPRARAPQVRLRLLLFTGGETDVADSGDVGPLEVRVGVGHTYGKTERLRSVLPAGLPIELRHEAPRHLAPRASGSRRVTRPPPPADRPGGVGGYSARNDTRGSTLAARRAGRYDASKADAISNPPAIA